MKIGVVEIEGWERDAFRPLESEHEIRYFDHKLTPENVHSCADVEVLSTFIYSELNDTVLRELPRLRMIAVRSTGVDNIDLQACKARGIEVANVPDYGAHTVAEHTFGLLLTLSHHLYESIDRTRKGDFTAQGLQGFDLQGKTLGVIGTGSIGANVVRIGLGFGMKVLGFDRKADESLTELGNFQYVSFNELLSNSDVISLHVPSLPETKNLLSQAAFERMKNGVVILNTARGDLIDIDALVMSLASGKVRAAGLDVLAEEPTLREESEVLRSIYQRKHNLDRLLADHVLLRLRNVIVTPHNAFNTREAVGRILANTVDSIRRFALAVSASRRTSAPGNSPAKP